MTDTSKDAEILQRVIAALSELPADSRDRILQMVSIFFHAGVGGFPQTIERVRSSAGFHHTNPAVTHGAPHVGSHASNQQPIAAFSEDRSPSPKQFLVEKRPRTEVERIVCLAYYLAHYRDTPFFKTLELSKLNTEAAQRKFSNPAYTVNQAYKLGYFVTATKGNKQLSAGAERFVQLLPDYSAAKEAMDVTRPSRRSKSTDS